MNLSKLKKRINATHCFYCKLELGTGVFEPTVDHRVPRIKGGEDVESNLVICCRRCNKWKGGQTEEKFLEQLPKYLEWILINDKERYGRPLPLEDIRGEEQ